MRRRGGCITPTGASASQALMPARIGTATAPIWFALRLLPTTFGVFDAFHDENGRQAHLSGPIAQALVAPELLASPPAIDRVDVLGLENDGSA